MGVEEDWRRIGGELEEDRRRIGVDWRRIFIDFRSSDGCRWIVFGLVTPQDGLVTPPVCGNYVPTSVKNTTNL